MDPRFSAALVVLLAVGLGALLLSAWNSRSRRRRARLRSRRAVDGEARSEVLLADAGFVILARQPRLAFALSVDGASRSVELRADWLVERGGRRFVADTKTGGKAPSLDHAPTRRQLLEYRVAYEVDGVLLVDAETDRIHEVVFPALHSPSPDGSALHAMLFFAVAALFGLLLLSPG